MAAETERDEDLERQLNLTFAFIDAARRGNGYLDPEWLREHVAGYADAGGEAARKRLQRDVRMLRGAGLPIEEDPQPGRHGYRLAEERYELPAIEFTPEEAGVLGLAGDLGQASELGAFARSGWTKLAAAGVDRDLADSPGDVFTAANDLARVPGRTVRAVASAVFTSRAVRFSYLRDKAAAPVVRRMDPWGVVNHADRLYLVGHDLDRNAPRAFRLLRVHDVEVTDRAVAHPAGKTDLQQIVADLLARGRRTVDAHVRLTAGRAQELRQHAETVAADGTAFFRGVDRDWLVRTVAGYGADAVIADPADVRAEVVDLLRGTARPEAAAGGEERA